MAKIRRLPSSLGDLSLGAANRCPAGFILRRGYRTRKGVSVSPGCVPDTGAPGKTPPSGKTLPEIEAGGLRGWKKRESDAKRHAALRKVVRDEGCAAAIRKLTLLRNKSADPGTKKRAMGDAAWLRKQRFCELARKEKA